MTDEHVASVLRRAEGHESELAYPLVRALEVTGAAVSTLGDLLGTETISASDREAARLDELQFDLGEGPCWDTFQTGRPVLEPDLRARPQRRWPAFSHAISEDEVGAIYALPLSMGTLRLGAVDLYSRQPGELDAARLEQAIALTSVVARVVLRRALRLSAEDGQLDDGNRYSRRLIHQATGMVIAQLRISPEDAHLLIQGHAFASGSSMQAVAEQILEGRMEFVAGENGIEAST